MRRAARVLVALLALAGAWPERAYAEAAAPDTAAPLLTRRDTFFALATTAAVAITAAHDRRATAEAIEWNSTNARGLSRAARQMGEPLAIAPVLLAVDVVARLAHTQTPAAASERIALSIATATLATMAVKLVTGRVRPFESPDNAAKYRPFSGEDSFPSGHSAIAFALASSLDHETRSRWVPCIAYPMAALTAWSRVRDDRHWASDVVAGAALGSWVARKVDTLSMRRWPDGLVLVPVPQASGVEVRARLKF